MSSEITERQNDGAETIVLKNEEMEAWLNSKGATLMRLYVKDRDGKLQDVVLGHENIDEYETYKLYFGATVGRVCNRIKKGEFELNGKSYQLPINNGPNSLHGGIKGFSFVPFKAELKDDRVIFTRTSPDGEEGYPGNLEVKIEYILDGNTLIIHDQAKADEDTLVNLTNHSYFNLDGDAESVADQILRLNADSFVCVDSDGLATGEISEVKDTPFDFTSGKPVKEAYDDSFEQEKLGSGLDHHFIFSQDQNQASLYSEKTGIELIMNTTQNGAQIYSANFLNDEPGKYGKPLKRRSGICFETQKMPDDIHITANHPTTLLRKGDVFDETTSFTFKVK